MIIIVKVSNRCLKGHSCLVPITETCIKTLYVFVEINIDVNHWLETIRFNFTEKSDMYILNTYLS